MSRKLFTGPQSLFPSPYSPVPIPYSPVPIPQSPVPIPQSLIPSPQSPICRQGSGHHIIINVRQTMSDEIKAFYKLRTETNWTKRYESPYPVRRYFFRTLYRLIIDYCKNYELVLDSGCGDGVLSVLLAHQNSEQR